MTLACGFLLVILMFYVSVHFNSTAHMGEYRVFGEWKAFVGYGEVAGVKTSPNAMKGGVD